MTTSRSLGGIERCAGVEKARGRRRCRVPVAITVAVAMSACAAVPRPGTPAPNLAPIVGSPAPSHALLYARCIAQAVEADTYDRTSDPDTHLLRFTCRGAPARAFYDGLEHWSTAIGSEWLADARTWRSTQKVVHDLFGVDYCSARAGGEDAVCVVVLNTGMFLLEES